MFFWKSSAAQIEQLRNHICTPTNFGTSIFVLSTHKKNLFGKLSSSLKKNVTLTEQHARVLVIIFPLNLEW
jgi:hypothetical protein